MKARRIFWMSVLGMALTAIAASTTASTMTWRRMTNKRLERIEADLDSIHQAIVESNVAAWHRHQADRMDQWQD